MCLAYWRAVICTYLKDFVNLRHLSQKLNTLQLNLDLLTDSVINAQKGVLQPQVISPVTLMGALIKSVSAFPKDTALPFLCARTQHNYYLHYVIYKRI